MIRDCVASREVWEVMLLKYPQSNFFTHSSTQLWLYAGMREYRVEKGGFGWKEIMAIVIWCLSKWNDEIFEKGTRTLNERIQFIQRRVEESTTIWGRRDPMQIGDRIPSATLVGGAVCEPVS